MDDIKHKFLDLIKKHQSRNDRVPEMGFIDNYTKKLSSTTTKAANNTKDVKLAQPISLNICDDDDDPNDRRSLLIPDEEILQSTEEIYFQENVDTGIYELNKFIESDMDEECVQRAMLVLKQQHKVISKKVLQNILEKRNPCNNEIVSIQETDRMLQDSLLECKKARSYLSCARKNLTTTNLQILATYKKREVLHEILETLQKLKKIKSTEIQLQKLLDTHNYSGAISLLLECKRLAAENSQYVCVEALSQKLQDTLLLAELQLDNVLGEITQSFDVKKYTNLQEAFRLLGKSIIAMDQLHMNFISTIHSTAFTVLLEHVERSPDDKQKLLFEEMCENVSAEKFIPCLIKLCKSFWCILVCYYQVALWHQNAKPNTKPSIEDTNIDTEQHFYVQQKFKTGYNRIWNDIQSKVSVYLSSSTKLHTLKYEQFIQVLSIVQRLRKVGVEFCNEPSNILMESMKLQSMQFFQRYHISCLDEICLFLDNEAWMPVHSFTSLIQLQEFHAVKSSLQRFFSKDKAITIKCTDDDISVEHKDPATESNMSVIGSSVNQRMSPLKRIAERKKSYENYLATGVDETISIHSQEDCNSSVYGSCGYFLRFSEKSSPFDGGFDEAMLEEDILAGIADESSCYFSEESEEEQTQDTNTNDTIVNNSILSSKMNITVNNSSLNVLRCIGRYLQMCKLLHSISPQIVKSMTELIDFYIFVVHEFFAKDMPLSSENLYTNDVANNLNRISYEIIPKVKNWPSSISIIQGELSNPETVFGLMPRIVGIETAITLVQQFAQIRGYLEHLLSPNDHKPLTSYFAETPAYLVELRKPIYMCVAARIIDLQYILTSMGKVKWDINHVNVEHSAYINYINRGLQTFSMRLEEIEKMLTIPKEPIWDSVAHVISHTLVEGYSNAKKCSAGGRALMQLDFAHFMSILELLSGLKFGQHHRYVDSYIKAYYMPKDLLETWIIDERNKNNYSTKQFAALIACTCVNDKKTRQKLLTILDQDMSIELNDSRISDAGIN